MNATFSAARIVFDPLVPTGIVAALAVLAALVVALALWRGLSGGWLRALASLTLLAALANPSLEDETRAPLSDIVLAVVDESASQQIGDRAGQSARALADLEAAVAALPDTELQVVRVGDGEDNAGTLLLTRLGEALARIPRARLAGVVAISDGRVHDLAAAPALPAPLHLLLTGHARDWDRRLVVKDAPAFAIMGEPVMLTLAIEDQGAAPEAAGARLSLALDGGTPQVFTVPVGEDIRLPLTLPHGGINVIEATVEPAPGELTPRNNGAVIRINGVRDRLRVLLVSGEPHAGERTWRNLLKSDSSVDLVHFTILRPPDKLDWVPVSELSLIEFPTRELFMEKIDDFDLIIFDRFALRGVLPLPYLDNVRAYIEHGGAVLVAAGPEYASAESLYRSPLGLVLPAAPTGQVVEAPFRPALTDLGRRHPVTEGLEAFAPRPADADGPGWGRWFRRLEVTPVAGETVMEAGGEPLLQLARVGRGRVALLASDQAWLWTRGYEGGGPQLELLRRLAHWMMKEPELEEESLTATATGQDMVVVRRTLGEGARALTITAPDGTVTVEPMTETAPGHFEAAFHGETLGLYRLAEGDLRAVAALGPSAPREFEETVASGAALAPLVASLKGGVVALEDGIPSLRRVDEGRPAAGRGWIGITPRNAFLTTGITLTALIRPWLFLLAAAMLAALAWLVEGRRTRALRRSDTA